MGVLDELLTDIFDDSKPSFYAEFEGWLRDSKRFRAFVVTYRAKIRAKLRNARDEGGRNDVRAELETAALLLRAEKFTLEYEKYTAAKQRGPDFTVTFKTHTSFNVEVRRIRRIELDDADAEALVIKLMAVLCEKVRQMPPSIVNILWLTGEREIPQTDLSHAVTTLRELAEHKAEEWFTRRGFASAADFINQFRRLSAIVLHSTDAIVIWQNPLARHPAPTEIVLTLQRLVPRNEP